MANSSPVRGALVTGAGAGIGRATARLLARQGWGIAAVDKDGPALTSLGAELEAEDLKALLLPCDISDPSQRADACSKATDGGIGPLGLVVNCAGIGRYAGFLDLSEADWRRMFEINVLAGIAICRAVLPGMIARKEGRVIFIGSQRASEPTSATSAYSGTKAALHGVAQSLGLELNSAGIGFSVLDLGGVRTGFRDTPAAEKDTRFLDPWDVAEIIGFIASRPNGVWLREATILPMGV